MKKSEAAVIWAEEQIAMLQPLLNIPHWRINVRYRPKLTGCYARARFQSEKHDVTLDLPKLFVQSSRVDREHTILHELIHIQREDAVGILRDCADQAAAVQFNCFWAMEEKSVDDMAWVLHGLIYGEHASA